jgi:hypothetical protein
MGRSVSVTFGKFTFKSKAAAIKVLREVRDGHPDHMPILDEDTVELLLGVVAAHPQSRQKAGVGITGFFVARSPEYPSRCFYLRRIDGTETDFSWNEAISPTQPLLRLKMACRNAIYGQKKEYKDTEWPMHVDGTKTCPITGEEFDRDTAHVDHQPPQTFSKLVDDWMNEEGVALGDVGIDHIGDMMCVDTFQDDAQRDSWRSFHSKHAILRLVSATGNLRQGARFLGL